MAERFTEAEPVIVDTDRPGSVLFELDDGTQFMLDERELRAALAPRATEARAA